MEISTNLRVFISLLTFRQIGNLIYELKIDLALFI